MAKDLILLACILACAGVTECGAVGGGALQRGTPSPDNATDTACATLRRGGECPSSGVCKIAIVGDSIPTRPTPGTLDMGTELQELVGACATVDNFAASGNHCDHVIDTQYPDNVQGNGYHVIINNCGVNDLNGGATAADTLVDREALSAAVLAEGGPLVMDLSVMPWGGFASHTAGKQTETDSLNTSLSTPINAATIYVETYSGMEDDVTPDDLEADYDSGDGLHPNAAGAAALAAIVYTELTTP